VGPWRSVQNPSASNCTLLVSLREPLIPISCPICPTCLPVASCPPPAPVILSIGVAKDWLISSQREKYAKDAENIRDFCSRIQKYMPLIRPNDTYSNYANLQQKGWKDSPFVDTKISIKILHQMNKGFWKQLPQKIRKLQSTFTFGLSDLIHSSASGKR